MGIEGGREQDESKKDGLQERMKERRDDEQSLVFCLKVDLRLAEEAVIIAVLAEVEIECCTRKDAGLNGVWDMEKKEKKKEEEEEEEKEKDIIPSSVPSIFSLLPLQATSDWAVERVSCSFFNIRLHLKEHTICFSTLEKRSILLQNR